MINLRKDDIPDPNIVKEKGLCFGRPWPGTAGWHKLSLTAEQEKKLKAVLEEVGLKFDTRSWTEVEKVYETRWDCPSEQDRPLPFKNAIDIYRPRYPIPGVWT